LIATDGVFSMDGYVARLPAICALAEKYGAVVMVDDCHATGHLGEGGRGCAGKAVSISGKITHRLSVTEFKSGFEFMRTGNCGQIVLDWKT
jgi:7-keto-8-aminopelargonate synthetase-like enzyme